MDHLQIIIIIVVVLIAACVALICDSLQRNNEQLRELTIELKVRQEVELNRAQALAPRPAEPVQAVERTPKAEPVVTEKKRTVNSDALSAMERGAALAASGKRPRAAIATPSVPKKAEVVSKVPEVIMAAEPVAKASAAKKDWGALLSRNVQAPKNASVITRDGERSLPAGFQDGFVLTKLVQSHQPVSGLVVSIGVNASREADGTLPESVRELVGSLIGPNDFAAQSSDDEFLLIYPEEHGAPAQRRLSQIAQKLWDFQLRSLGSFQILFSWGGVEVRSESIDEALASASERMQETKRGRKLLTMAAPAPAATPTILRQAV